MYWVTGIIGMVLFFSPYMFGFVDNTNALWATTLIGIITVLLSIFEGMEGDTAAWEYKMALFLGVTALLAPFILGFNNQPIAMWTVIFIGFLLSVTSGRRVFKHL